MARCRHFFLALLTVHLLLLLQELRANQDFETLMVAMRGLGESSNCLNTVQGTPRKHR